MYAQQLTIKKFLRNVEIQTTLLKSQRRSRSRRLIVPPQGRRFNTRNPYAAAKR